MIFWNSSFTLSYGRSRCPMGVHACFTLCFFWHLTLSHVLYGQAKVFFQITQWQFHVVDFQSQQLRPIATYFNCSYILHRPWGYICLSCLGPNIGLRQTVPFRTGATHPSNNCIQGSIPRLWFEFPGKLCWNRCSMVNFIGHGFPRYDGEAENMCS